MLEVVEEEPMLRLVLLQVVVALVEMVLQVLVWQILEEVVVGQETAVLAVLAVLELLSSVI